LNPPTAGFPVYRGPQGDATTALLCTAPGTTLVASARFTVTIPWDSYRIGLTRLRDRPCLADFDRNGGVDGADVEAFFRAWEAGDHAADVNSDGGVDGAHVEVFFRAWEASGCD